MALFSLYCLDNETDGAVRRAAARADHLAWARAAGDIVRMAGPLLGEDGETMLGSNFIIQADDLAAAKAFHAEDPYVKAGVFGQVFIRETKWSIGTGAPE
ncbi:MAG: YciI family protein [Hyphomonas sp.]